jgi:hypothetical protein
MITLGAPFRGTVVHAGVLRAAEIVRDLPASVAETAIYTRQDGVVDWRYCITDNPAVDFEVNGTHIGLAFNSSVHGLIAQRSAGSLTRKRPRKSRRQSPVQVGNQVIRILQPNR